jgi:hypothetical protein
VLLSWSQLAVTFAPLVVLVRYRAMIPLMLLILLVEHLGRRALIMLNPTERAEGVSIGFYINVALAAVLLAGLALSVWRRRTAKEFA